MRIPVSKLSTETSERLLHALRVNAPDTFVIDHSRKWIAGMALASGLTVAGGVFLLADSFRWIAVIRVTFALILGITFPSALLGLGYLLRWSRAKFGDRTFLNPIYSVRFLPTEIVVREIARMKDFKQSSHEFGVLPSPQIKLLFEEGSQTIRLQDATAASRISLSLAQFPFFVTNLRKQGEEQTLYEFDLFQEADFRAEIAGPVRRSPFREVADFARNAVCVLLGLCLAAWFFSAVDRRNDFRDDENRWELTRVEPNAIQYRAYLKSRPTGRHVKEAHDRVDELYANARRRYLGAAQDTPGIRAVTAMLDYAQRTGDYVVSVKFAGRNEIPQGIEEQFRKEYKHDRIVPLGDHFGDVKNRIRESQIMGRITAQFRQAIPGDILELKAMKDTDRPQPLIVAISYLIVPSFGYYVLREQDSLPAADQDWTVAVQFLWSFEVTVPGKEGSPFKFAVQSTPAEEFSGDDVTASSRYDAMANSNFESFGTELLRVLAVSANPSGSKPPERQTKK